MLKFSLKNLVAPALTAAALLFLNGPISAATFVDVNPAGAVNAQAQLDITNFLVQSGSTTFTYTTIDSSSGSTIGGDGMSTSDSNAGPNFEPTSATINVDGQGGQTYAQATISDPNTFRVISEVATTDADVVATATNTNSFFFTVPDDFTGSTIDLTFTANGSVYADGSVAQVAGTSATAQIGFDIDTFQRNSGSSTVVDTHANLISPLGVSIPLFGTTYTLSDSVSGNFTYTITGVQAGQTIQIKLTEFAKTTAQIGTATPPVVPEPSSLVLACLGMLSLAGKGLRRRMNKTVA